MSEQKKPIEIECPSCKTRFRLWVPANLFYQWKDSEEIGCIKCRKQIKLEKRDNTYQVTLVQPVKEIITPVSQEKVFPIEKDEKLSILIVDDDGLVRKMAENVLARNQFTPLIAQNGPDALNIIKTKQVAIVIVDLYLKNSKDPQAIMDGEEFLQRLADTGKNIPAIVTTGKEIVDEILLNPKWYSLHVRCFIQKGNPFWIDELMIKIKEILK